MTRKDSRKRSLIKSFSWRFFATFITMFVAYILTGETTIAIEIGLLDTAIKTFAYYGHERAWNRLYLMQ